MIVMKKKPKKAKKNNMKADPIMHMKEVTVKAMLEKLMAIHHLKIHK
jgi:hypothetical protein